MSETQMSFGYAVACVLAYLVISQGGVQAIREGCVWLYGAIAHCDGWLMQAYQGAWYCTALYFLPSLVRNFAFFWDPAGPNCWACLAVGFVGGAFWMMTSGPVTVPPLCRFLNITAEHTSVPGQ